MGSKLFIVALWLFRFYNPAFTQTPLTDPVLIRGKITDQVNARPLPYANVGILNKSLGTVGDSLGNFSFQAGRGNLTDTLQISLIGYASKKMSVKDFLDNKEVVVRLNIKVTELPAFTVTNGRTKTETLGRQASGKLVQLSVHNKKSADGTIGSEMGMKYKTAHPGALLKDFNFYISVNNFNAIKFRINIYSVKNNLPDTLICNRQIFATLDSFKTGWTSVDLTGYDVKVPKQFIVTMQWIESRMDKKENPLTVLPVALTLFSKNCYTRIASQDKWKKMGVNLSNYVTLTY